ncbi:uncharacterized protein LOC143853011 isoform X2 [Tasmannia lanceolata]|uniref:uncharacterized protein LOC143853011 isoform X2 n=1 Tax=Tasmannia lanceolata TaxID=3420 RepID=UPI004062C61B
MPAVRFISFLRVVIPIPLHPKPKRCTFVAIQNGKLAPNSIWGYIQPHPYSVYTYFDPKWPTSNPIAIWVHIQAHPYIFNGSCNLTVFNFLSQWILSTSDLDRECFIFQH